MLHRMSGLDLAAERAGTTSFRATSPLPDASLLISAGFATAGFALPASPRLPEGALLAEDFLAAPTVTSPSRLLDRPRTFIGHATHDVCAEGVPAHKPARLGRQEKSIRAAPMKRATGAIGAVANGVLVTLVMTLLVSGRAVRGYARAVIEAPLSRDKPGHMPCCRGHTSPSPREHKIDKSEGPRREERVEKSMSSSLALGAARHVVPRVRPALRQRAVSRVAPVVAQLTPVRSNASRMTLARARRPLR